MTYDSLPFSGIATFFKAPLVAAPTTADADVAVVGIGWDEGTTSRSGARMGPRALREASTLYAFQRDAEPFWDGEAGVELLGGVRWADCGDVALGPMWSPERYHNAVVDKLQPIMKSGLFPVTLGGDHSIGYPVLKALYQARGGKPVHLVQFDTHMDYWDEEGGSRFSHASPIIRSHEAGFLAGLTQYGIRSLHTPGDNIALAKSRGAHIFWCQQAKDMLVDDLVEHLPKGGDVYITFDIDALDPAIAPGTGTPEPGGFSYYEAKDILLGRVRPLQRGRHGPRRGGAAVRRPRPGHGAARRPADPRHGGRRLPQARGAAVSGALRRGLDRATAALTASDHRRRIGDLEHEALERLVLEVDRDRVRSGRARPRTRGGRAPASVRPRRRSRAGASVRPAPSHGPCEATCGSRRAPCTCSSGTTMRLRNVQSTSRPEIVTRRCVAAMST